MSDLLNVADQVKTGARRLQWILQLADALERVGSLEQAERETTQRLNAARDELANLESGLSQARTRAPQIIAEAEARAREIEATALAQAQEVDAAAAARAMRADADHKARMQVLHAEEQTVADATRQARSTLERVRAEIKAEEGKLEAVRAAVQEKLASFMR